nr:CRISPR-associated protein Cas5 [Methanothermus fervidus]
MEAVRFIVEGLINSFRMPQTSIYQLTCLAPTKTQVVGMLTNIMGKNERDYYALLDKVQVGIIPVYINSIFNDAWTFKKWKSAGAGRDILQHEKIYRGKYLIYVSAEDSHLLEKMMEFLMYPSRVPSLGMDDEMVIIREPKKLPWNQRMTQSYIVYLP